MTMLRSRATRGVVAAVIWAGALLGAGAASAQDKPADPLVLGTYELESPYERAIIDGDTIRVKGLDATLRLVGMDTEETFKKKEEKELFKSGWASYQAAMQKESGGKPGKYATPLGEDAKHFAEDFFRGQTHVRLELDETTRTRGYYGRYLVYVMVQRNGKWVNYNVEAVRAGMAPYFTKYGYSKRFHKEFTEAQAEAQKKKLGIWKPGAQAYPDYAERLTWWGERAETIKRFEAKHQGKKDVVMLGLESEWDRLIAMDGMDVTVFGTVGDLVLDKTPYRAYLSHQKNNDFALISFRQGDVEKLGLERYSGEYVYVRGRVSIYKGRPQFKLEEAPVKVWVE